MSSKRTQEHSVGFLCPCIATTNYPAPIGCYGTSWYQRHSQSLGSADRGSCLWKSRGATGYCNITHFMVGFLLKMLEVPYCILQLCKRSSWLGMDIRRVDSKNRRIDEYKWVTVTSSKHQPNWSLTRLWHRHDGLQRWILGGFFGTLISLAGAKGSTWCGMLHHCYQNMCSGCWMEDNQFFWGGDSEAKVDANSLVFWEGSKKEIHWTAWYVLTNACWYC